MRHIGARVLPVGWRRNRQPPVSGERAFQPGASTDLKPSGILESIANRKAHKAEMAGRPSQSLTQFKDEAGCTWSSSHVETPPVPLHLSGSQPLRFGRRDARSGTGESRRHHQPDNIIFFPSSTPVQKGSFFWTNPYVYMVPSCSRRK
jgi:hypothetical protein